ncbi:hypothetical protein U1Q18_034754 [Sarracenia purpurea var. burkii]
MLRSRRTRHSVPLKTNIDGSIGMSHAARRGATAVEARHMAHGRNKTLATNRCITITSMYQNDDKSSSKFFVDGVEITRSDIYNDGGAVRGDAHR